MLKKPLLIIIFFLLLSGGLQAQKVNETDRLIKIQRLLRIYDVLKQFSGVAIVAKDGVPLYKYTAGITNFDYRVPNSLSGQFNMFGITESFTALGIMQLVQQGKINLDATVGTYLPQFTNPQIKKLTLEQLLSHSSGLTDYYKLPNYVGNFLTVTSISDLTKIIDKEPLQFEPGSMVQRSPSNYVILAAIIEKISGQSYSNYLKQYIFTPGGLNNAALYYWYESVSNKAVGYTFDDNNKPITNAAFWGAYPFGADGVYCNAEELVAFLKNLSDGKLLSNTYLDKMFTAYTDPDVGGYGLGWKIKQYADSSKVIYQSGGVQGLSTFISYSPVQKYAVVVLSNYNPNTAQFLGGMIDQALYTDDFLVPANAVAFQLNKLAQDNGFDYLISHFDELSAKNSIKIDGAWLLHGYGRDLMQKGEYTNALEIFKINLRKFPNEPVVYDGMGDCYYKMAKPEMAQYYFEEKLRKKPDDNYARSMLKMIKDYRK